MSGDMTRGNPFKQILLFSFPVFVANMCQQLYNMCDTVIVGRTVSSDAMSGVGSTGSITFLILGIALGLTAGFSVVVSNFYGAGNIEGVRRSIANSLVLCVIIAVLLTAFSVPFAGPILRLMRTPEQYYEYAYWYLYVVFYGIGATVLYNIGAGILRALGNSKAPLAVLVITALLNIALDLLFIVVFDMEKIGAGLATIISQFAAGVLCLIYLFIKYPELCPKKKDWRIGRVMTLRLIGVGLPMAIQYAITAVGCIFRQFALNDLNAENPGIVTAYAATSKIENLLACSYTALGVAMATYCGQNFGAKKHDRIKQGVFIGMCYCVVSWILGALISVVAFDPLMNMFIDKNSGDAILYFDAMMAYSREFMLYLNIFFPTLGAVYIYRNALQSIGRSASTMIAGTLELIARCAMVFGVVHIIGYPAAFLAEPFAWIAADLFLVPMFYYSAKKLGSTLPPKKLFSTKVDT